MDLNSKNIIQSLVTSNSENEKNMLTIMIQQKLHSLIDATPNDRNKIFNELAQVQHELAKASFKHNIFLSQPLNKFIRDFDRIDDKDTQNFILKKIQAGQYSIEINKT